MAHVLDKRLAGRLGELAQAVGEVRALCPALLAVTWMAACTKSLRPLGVLFRCRARLCWLAMIKSNCLRPTRGLTPRFGWMALH